MVVRRGARTIQGMAAKPTETSEPTPTRLVLVRHGESKVTVRRVIGGYRTCDGLSPLGFEQARGSPPDWPRPARSAPTS